MLKYMAIKEFSQLRRDRRMFPVIFLAPVLQLVVFGYAVTTDVREIPLVLCDQDHSAASRRMREAFAAAGYFTEVAQTPTPSQFDRYLDGNLAQVGIVIPQGFGRDLAAGNPAQLGAFIDGADANAAMLGMNYTQQIAAKEALAILAARAGKSGLPLPGVVSIKPRVWYNEDLNSKKFFIPGILGMILMIMTMMLTSMALVREKEMGTLEQLVVTPIKVYQLILGKLFPFIIIGFIDVCLVVAVAGWWFQIPLKGSLALLFALSALFLLSTLGLGLFISTISRTQQQAMMTTLFFFMMPFIYLSGFVFPIENMPQVLQYVTYAIPLRYYLTIVRGIFLKGAGLTELWPAAAGLGVCGLVILTASIAKFRKNID